MINVSANALLESSLELKKQRIAIIEQCDKISSVLITLSKYTDFDIQLKKLYEIKKRLEDDSVLSFSLGRVLELSVNCYKDAEKEVIALLEEENTNNRILPVSEQRVPSNPEYISIV